MKWSNILLFLTPVLANVSELPQNITSSPCTDQNHLFLVPGVLTAGGTNRACLSRFHPEGSARMLLTLLVKGESVSAMRQLNPGDGGCLDISVPLQPNSKAELVVNIRYPEASCTWERRVPLRISSGRLLIIHTERAKYRPGDLVRFRLIALKADLTPAHTNIDEIWLEGPRGAWEGTRLAQWPRVRTRFGIAQQQYQLDELAPVGKWTLRARLGDGTQGSAFFSVANYEVPPFQLSVRHAPRILRTSERLVWTVCVRYPWSEAVEGMLVIRIRGAGSAGGIRTATRLRARACHRHAAAARRIGLMGDAPPDVIIADFSFQEEGTRIWQNTTVVSQVVDDPVTLEFLTKQGTVVSSGLPYKLKVKATRWDDKPASNETVRICKSPANSIDTIHVGNSSCIDSLTDEKGIARVMFTADGSPFYVFRASTNSTSATLHLTVGSGRAALGPLRAPTRSRTLVPLYVNIPDVSKPLTVHFVVITRGGIIYRWGATTQCPTSTDQVLTASRDSTCQSNNIRHQPGKITKFSDWPNMANTSWNINSSNPELWANMGKFGSFQNFAPNASSDVLDSLLDGQLLKIMLPIKVTHQMCPDSHLVAYFYHGHELISASKHFEMDECFVNKVELSWSTRQALPGSIANLHISTPGPALCALSVIDTASKWVQPVENIKDLILRNLRKLMDSHRNMTEYDAAGECFFSEDSPSAASLAEAWLAGAGVRLAGGARGARGGCAPAALVAGENASRSDFSEAWLWRLVAVGANGSVVASARTPDSITRFEASALCLAKTGVAVSQPAVLQVFREFFLHADGPRRLRRGDDAVVRYRLFNYLYRPLSVHIEALAEPHLSGAESRRGCVAARAALSGRLQLRARRPGAARLALRAAAAAAGGGCGATADVEVTDEVIIEIQVDPEGVPVQEHKSIMLCGRDRGVGGSTESEVKWNWSKADIVPGTESVTLWAASDLTGPLLADADSLTQLPRGCGEQNMARLATNLLALSLLHPDSSAAYIAKDHVARGFARQMQYSHPGGGFSAFGSSDPRPSTWLTAFCVRYLRRAHQVISPGELVPSAVELAERWLLSQQMENGCFRNEGQVFHRELKGGLNEDGDIANVALTAYVITSLIESSGPLSFTVIQNSLSCLRALPPKKASKAYTYSLVTYAYLRIRRYERELRESNEAGENSLVDEEMKELIGLMKMAKRKGDLVWWESGSLSASVEATGYALLSLGECVRAGAGRAGGAGGAGGAACAACAGGAAAWLAARANPAGGFVSTQDTLVALEGLSRWSSAVPSSTNLTLIIRSGVITKALHVSSSSRLPQVVKLPVGDVSVSADGTGCSVIQATRLYNSLSVDEKRDKLLKAQVSVLTDGPFNCDGNTTCFCAAVVEVCVQWSDQFPEMALLEVSLPGGYGADTALLYKMHLDTRTLVRRIEVSSNNGRVILYLGAHASPDTSHECYKIHAVGPKVRTKPAYAKIVDYYRPDINDIQMYTIPEECPPRISHENNDYITSDNIFNKAKSLNGDIIITHDFSFEDIPEGIPLEDPLYDNLTERKDKINTSAPDTNKPVDFENEIISDDEFKYTRKDRTRKIDTNDVYAIEDNVTKPDEQQELKKSLDTEKEQNAIIYKHDENKRDAEMEDVSLEIPKEKKDKKATSINNAIKINETSKRNEEEILLNNENKNKQADISAMYIDKDAQKADLQTNTGEKERVATDAFPNFHVIDTEKDLEVPSGVEGPVPSYVLPPENFVFQGRSGEPYYQRPDNKLHVTPNNAYYINPYFNQKYYSSRNI
ncbi:pregnancy zone protein-like [Zerene cesonia]|uniref:pregnancy zone protein-like n=1 Tax=Zerene cesonia TaxID=33412 RepID=UPI0018E4F224|nr:pregnancy zone protein-like [Zerene cesonia]